MFALRRTTPRALALLQLACSMSRGRRKPKGPRLPPKVLQRPDNGIPLVAQCYPERYDELLQEKVAKLEAALRSATSYASFPQVEVHESEREHFRMRAAFAVWHVGEEPDCTRHFVMYEKGDDSRDPHVTVEFPMGSRRINELMPIVREAIQPPALGRKIIDVRFLTTQKGDALIALAYNRDLKGCQDFSTEDWTQAAQDLHEKTGATIVGRSRKVKLVVGADDDTVAEELTVNGRVLTYAQQEGAFTQPNAGVCEQMLGWAVDATKESEGDLCELYCGGGTFTVALAPNFDQVVATELSKASVALAERNLAANAVENVRVARVPAEEVAAALKTGATPRRLQALDVDLASMGRGSLFVDPPRAGLDKTCSQIAAGFDRIVYVSCNPETLARDVRLLTPTHAVKRVAAFDQFPYTDHLECGVVLERRVD
jgi:tRNA (uracil-5-)-methyltransferase